MGHRRQDVWNCDPEPLYSKILFGGFTSGGGETQPPASDTSTGAYTREDITTAAHVRAGSHATCCDTSSVTCRDSQSQN